MGFGIEVFNVNGGVVMDNNSFILQFVRKVFGKASPSIGEDEVVAVKSNDWMYADTDKIFYIFKVANYDENANFGLNVFNEIGKPVLRISSRTARVVGFETVKREGQSFQGDFEHYPLGEYAIFYSHRFFGGAFTPFSGQEFYAHDTIFKVTSRGFLVKAVNSVNEVRRTPSYSKIMQAVRPNIQAPYNRYYRTGGDSIPVLIVDVAGL